MRMEAAAAAGGVIRVQPVPGGLFQPERLMLSGEVAILRFETRADETTAKSVRQALHDPGLRSAFRARIAQHVEKTLGSDYTATPLALSGDQAMEVLISTGYVEVSGPEEVIRKVGGLAQSLAGELSGLLSERLADETGYSVRPDWQVAGELFQGSRPVSREASDAEVQAQLGRLLARRRQHLQVRQRGLSIAILAAVAIVIGAPTLGLATDSVGVGVGAALYVALFAAMGLVAWLLGGSYLTDVEGDIRQITDEIDLRNIDPDKDRERRAQKLFQAHSSEIKRYYDQALRQAKHVYYVGVGSMLLGVGVIGASFALILTDAARELPEQVIVGSLGAIGAVLANFIGVIYLRMFSDTIAALTGFHGRLVVTHHLHFGNFLAAKISQEPERDKALSEMAATLAATHLDATPEPVVK
jgi:hypothetical protein